MREAIKRSDVQALVDRRGEALIDENIAAVSNVCRRAAPGAQDFCSSLQGQIEMVSFMHQHGRKHNPAIRDFVEGKVATPGADSGAQSVQLDGKMDLQKFREEIRDNAPFARDPNYRRGIDERDGELNDYYRNNGIHDGSRWKIDPIDYHDREITTLVPDRDTEDARTPDGNFASLHGQGTPEQSANAGASDVQRTSHRTVWNPDLAKLDEAVASVGAQDLAPWARNLLGRDVMANGPDAAVKGLQRAINEATKPPTFDYHWGLGGRTGRIDVDGDLGPQTRAGLGRAIDKQGEDGFKKLYALDQFGRYVQRVGRGRARVDDLEDTLAGTLGQAVPDAPERAQETLNMFAEDREEPGAPLKIDGWVGPKTTEAFGTLLNKTSPDRMMERFAGKDFWDDEGLI
jgi:hypothetical protein